MALTEDLTKKIVEQVEDEDKAFRLYTEMAADANQLGLYGIANDLTEIANQEYYHREVLLGALSDLKTFRLSGTGTPPIEEQPPGRLAPKTYGDWVDLAEDIKEKVGEGSPDYYEATHQLGIISELEEGSPGEAKRWLTRKAGDLGIR